MRVYRGSHPGVASNAPVSPEQTLLVLGGALGDVVLRLPLLRALGRARVLAPRAWGAMLVEAGLAARGDRLDDPKILALWGGDPGAVRESLTGLRRVVLTLADPPLRAALTALIGDVVALDLEPPVGVHQAIHLLAQLGAAPAAPEEIAAPVLPVPPLWSDAARILRAEAPDVLIVPGSGGLAKCWPLASYVRLIDALSARGRAPVVMLGPDELERGWSPDRLGAPTLLAPGLRETAAILARARVVVGNDAGTSHLAAAVGARVVVLFGPTDPARWRPMGPRVRVLRWTVEQPLDVEAVLLAIGD